MIYLSMMLQIQSSQLLVLIMEMLSDYILKKEVERRMGAIQKKY